MPVPAGRLHLNEVPGGRRDLRRHQGGNHPTRPQFQTVKGTFYIYDYIQGELKKYTILLDPNSKQLKVPTFYRHQGGNHPPRPQFHK